MPGDVPILTPIWESTFRRRRLRTNAPCADETALRRWAKSSAPRAASGARVALERSGVMVGRRRVAAAGSPSISPRFAGRRRRATGGADRRARRSTIGRRREVTAARERNAKARHDYRQVALIAKLWRGGPRENRFERFTPEGPMALLPGNDRYGLVGTARPIGAGIARPRRFRLPRPARASFGRDGGSPASPIAARFARARFAASPRTRAALRRHAARRLHPVAGRDSMSAARRWERAQRLDQNATRSRRGMLRRIRAAAHGSDRASRHARTLRLSQRTAPASLAARVGATFAHPSAANAR